MLTNKRSSLILVGLFIFATCSQEPALPDLSTIAWITHLGYSIDNIFPLLSSGSIPGPRVKVTVNNESKYLLLDFNAIDIFLKDNSYRNGLFEPLRMSNYITETSEILVEEGYLHDVSFLGNHYPDLYVSIIKRSSQPYEIPGIIGRNFLIDGQITIDMSNKILAFSTNPEHSLRDIYADSNLVSFDLNQSDGDQKGLIKFNCRVEDTEYLATISTRLATTQVNPELAAVIAGKDQSHKPTIQSLKIGKHRFSGINCQVNPDLLTLEPENLRTIDIVIGMDIISRGLLSIDFINGQLIIR